RLVGGIVGEEVTGHDQRAVSQTRQGKLATVDVRAFFPCFPGLSAVARTPEDCALAIRLSRRQLIARRAAVAERDNQQFAGLELGNPWFVVVGETECRARGGNFFHGKFRRFHDADWSLGCDRVSSASQSDEEIPADNEQGKRERTVRHCAGSPEWASVM